MRRWKGSTRHGVAWRGRHLSGHERGLGHTPAALRRHPQHLPPPYQSPSLSTLSSPLQPPCFPCSEAYGWGQALLCGAAGSGAMRAGAGRRGRGPLRRGSWSGTRPAPAARSRPSSARPARSRCLPHARSSAPLPHRQRVCRCGGLGGHPSILHGVPHAPTSEHACMHTQPTCATILCAQLVHITNAYTSHAFNHTHTNGYECKLHMHTDMK